MKLSSFPIERLAAFTVVAAGVLLLLRFFLAQLVLAALPFALAWLLAYLARPLALRVYKKLHLSLGAASVILVFFALLLCGVGAYFLARRAVLELAALGEQFASEGNLLDTLTSSVSAWWSGLVLRFPFLSSLTPEGGGMLSELAENALAEAVSALGDFAVHAAGGLVTALPNLTVFVLVTLVASFYFALDLGGIHARVLACLPPRVGEFAKKLKESAWLAAVGYLRAYLILMLVTFLILLVGFLVLRVDYALLLAALFALLDFLPVIGIEILLLPWGIFLLFSGNFPLGIGLLLLYGLLTLVRQILEPRLVGQSLGLHPLLALGAMYAGLQLFGFLGLMLFPGALLILRNAWKGKGGSKTANPGD